MNTASDWQGRVGSSWAASWLRTERAFAGIARVLDAAIAAHAPDTGRALDIGSGAGSTSLALAAARPGLRVEGADLSADLVAVARERVANPASGLAIGGETSVATVSGSAPGATAQAADVAIARTTGPAHATRGASERIVADTEGIAMVPGRVPAATGVSGVGVTNVTFTHANALDHATRIAPLDLIVSRHGVMFFDDPMAAFKTLAVAAAPGAPLVFSCFGARADNAWASGVDAVVGNPTPPPGYAPGPFGFADRTFVEQFLGQTGWTDIVATPHDVPFVVGEGDGESGIEDALGFYRRIGGAAPVLAAAGVDERARLEDELRAFLAPRIADGRVAFTASIWIWTARRDNA